MNVKTKLFATLLLVLTLALAACGPTATPTAVPEPTEAPPEPTAEPADEEMAEEEMPPSIAEIAAGDENFSTLVTALDAAGLVDTLAGEGEFTVFAPTNDAFAALPEGTVDGLLQDPEGALTDVLLYHVVEGNVTSDAVVELDSAPTLQGEAISITVADEGVMLNETVMVTTVDIEASNGVIHVVDAVLLPPSMSSEEASEEEMPPSIAEIAASDENFSTLVTALDAAGLVDTLAGEGEFTVFAPTNDAFAALPEGTVESLLEDPEGALTDVLLYHVVEGTAVAEDVVDLEAVTTLNGEDVIITVTDDGVLLNDTVMVVTTDIMASNGVIHVIDAVLLPPAMMETEAEAEGEMGEEPTMTIAEIAAGDENFSTLVTALDAANLVDVFAGEGDFTVFAPTNEAFAALPDGTLEALVADPEGDLTSILTYHVVTSTVTAEQVVELDAAPTLLGEEIAISVTDDGVVLNGSVNVIATDIMATNGVIHVIDAVLMPPSLGDEAEAEAEGNEEEVELITIAEVASTSPDFETLTVALTEAGLVDTFADPEAGPFTVFAPTDEAFEALPEGTLDALLEDPEGALANVLQYHVVEGAVESTAVVELDSATTLLGEDVTITVDDDGNVILNDSVMVILSDVEASNGIIHVIDAVLVPEG